MDVTKPYKFIGFGAMYVTKPYKFIGFGAMVLLRATIRACPQTPMGLTPPHLSPPRPAYRSCAELASTRAAALHAGAIARKAEEWFDTPGAPRDRRLMPTPAAVKRCCGRFVIGKASKAALRPAPDWNPAEIWPGSPSSGPEAVVRNIGYLNALWPNVLGVHS